MAKLKITLTHSATHRLPKQRKIVQALGFHHVNSTIVKKDNKSLRGALFQIAHLIKVEQVK